MAKYNTGGYMIKKYIEKKKTLINRNHFFIQISIYQLQTKDREW